MAGMKNLDRYLDEIKKGIPDIETRLNVGAEEGRLEQLARKASVLPAQLLELYRRFDGEDMAKETGFLAGLQFLPLEKALTDFAFLPSQQEVRPARRGLFSGISRILLQCTQRIIRARCL